VLQDRLVKEMRLAGIKTKDETNAFLGKYLPRHNERFRVYPTNDTDAHVRLPEHFDLDKHLCIKAQRTIKKDNTIAYEGRLYQLEASNSNKVNVEERLDGTLHIISKGVALKYEEISDRPKQVAVIKTDLREYNRPPKPSRIIHGKEGGNPGVQLFQRRLIFINKNRTFLNWLDMKLIYSFYHFVSIISC
jgi:hypothetical protein